MGNGSSDGCTQRHHARRYLLVSGIPGGGRHKGGCDISCRDTGADIIGEHAIEPLLKDAFVRLICNRFHDLVHMRNDARIGQQFIEQSVGQAGASVLTIGNDQKVSVKTPENFAPHIRIQHDLKAPEAAAQAPCASGPGGEPAKADHAGGPFPSIGPFDEIRYFRPAALRIPANGLVENVTQHLRRQC